MHTIIDIDVFSNFNVMYYLMISNIYGVLNKDKVILLKLDVAWFMCGYKYGWQVQSLQRLDSLNPWCVGRHFSLTPCSKYKLYSVIDS